MLMTLPCKPISRATMNNLVWLSKIARSALWCRTVIKISWIWWIDNQNKMIKSINTSILKLFYWYELRFLASQLASLWSWCSFICMFHFSDVDVTFPSQQTYWPRFISIRCIGIEPYSFTKDYHASFDRQNFQLRLVVWPGLPNWYAWSWEGKTLGRSPLRENNRMPKQRRRRR